MQDGEHQKQANGRLQNRHYIKKSKYWLSRGQINKEKIRLAEISGVDEDENENESLTSLYYMN